MNAICDGCCRLFRGNIKSVVQWVKQGRRANVDRKRVRGRTADGQPNPIDVHVGGRVRVRRVMLGLSQEALAGRLGITFQQVQKYERGSNRMGSSRLYDIAVALDVPVSFFFDDMPDEIASMSPRAIIKGADAAAPVMPGDESFSRRETFDLVRVYYAITDPSIRRRVYDLAKSLALPEN